MFLNNENNKNANEENNNHEFKRLCNFLCVNIHASTPHRVYFNHK
jgi:hypothetical protein